MSERLERTKGPYLIVRTPEDEGVPMFNVMAQPNPSMRGFTRCVAQFERRADAEAFVEAERLHNALKVIGGGHIAGLDNLALAGDWRGVAVELQKYARAALPNRTDKTLSDGGTD